MIIEELFQDLYLYQKWLIIYGVMIIRYLIFAGGAFLLFYIWKNHPWRGRKIQPKFPTKHQYYKEIGYSLSTFIIFTFTALGIIYLKSQGHTQIYTSIESYGWGYFVVSIFLMLLIHDTYFYWTHRLMHHPKIFRHVHLVHHLSSNPSPWAAFSFHPLEAIIEAGILPLIVFILPSHPLAIFLFFIIMILFNVLGHLGYEIYPKRFSHRFWIKFVNSSTHHNMHHKYFKYNYGLYFNLWDHWIKTNHPKYQSQFDETVK